MPARGAPRGAGRPLKIAPELSALCDKEKQGLKLGSLSLGCDRPPGSLAAIQPMLDACKDGTLAACEHLAGDDETALEMMRTTLRPLWVERGVTPSEVDAVFAGRVAPPLEDVSAQAPKGKITRDPRDPSRSSR